jgi:hypothetical protein
MNLYVLYGALIIFSVSFGYGDARNSPIGYFDVSLRHYRIASIISFISMLAQIAILILLLIYHGISLALLGLFIVGMSIGISCWIWRKMFGYYLDDE